MPPRAFAFTTKYNGAAAAIITTVAVCPAYDPASPPPVIPNSIPLSALWDTGSTGSVIAPDAAKRLGLVQVGLRDICHGGGPDRGAAYLVNIGLPNGVHVYGVEAVELKVSGFDFIIGMNIITKGDLAITNVGGETCFSFCIPPRRQLDFVVEANRDMTAGVGRNDPCPCGSGQKFKKCHGKPGAMINQLPTTPPSNPSVP